MREFILTIILAICLTPAEAQTRRGKASYYSKRATGARAASGVRIHHDSLTCAHRTYPFGTLLKVKNLSNGREVVVKVIDRGPFNRGRIIDLSYGAAKELGMLAEGIAMVEVKRLDSAPPYRMEEETGLPDFEFDFKDAAYSFIENWDLPDEPEQKLVSKKMPTKEQAKQKRQAIRRKANRTTAKANRNEAMKAQMKPHNGQQQKKKEEEASSWRNVFDKIKNWFE